MLDVAVDPINNRIYVIRTAFLSGYDANAGHANLGVPTSIPSDSVAVAVDPVLEKVYVVADSTTDILRFDGLTLASDGVLGLTTNMNPKTDIAVNTVTSEVFVTGGF